jgi:hypothetical protein
MLFPRISDPAHPPIRDATLPRKPHIIAEQLATHNPHKHTHTKHITPIKFTSRQQQRQQHHSQ